MDDLTHDLKRRILDIVYIALQREAESLTSVGGKPPSLLASTRLGSHFDVEAVRRDIRVECGRAGAGESATEFLTTCWLERFVPTVM